MSHSHDANRNQLAVTRARIVELAELIIERRQEEAQPCLSVIQDFLELIAWCTQNDPDMPLEDDHSLTALLVVCDEILAEFFVLARRDRRP